MQELNLVRNKSCNLEIICSRSKSYLFRIVSVYFQIILQYIKRLLNIGKIASADVIMVGFAPQIVLPFTRWMMGKKTIIIDFFISVYDTMVNDRKKLSPMSPLARFCHYIDRVSLSHADHIIADTIQHAKYFVDEFHAPSSSIETIYIEADSKIFYPRSNNFRVLYFGSILPLQGIEIILEAIRKLENIDGIRFEIIGPIPKRVSKPTGKNISYIKWLSQDELAEWIEKADLCLAGHFNADIEKAKRTIPGKAYIYEAMNKTMILGENAANREIFSEDERHIFVKMGDSAALASAIAKQMQLLNETAEAMALEIKNLS